jgi:hypothetical protein
MNITNGVLLKDLVSLVDSNEINLDSYIDDVPSLVFNPFIGNYENSSIIVLPGQPKVSTQLKLAETDGLEDKTVGVDFTYKLQPNPFAAVTPLIKSERNALPGIIVGRTSTCDIIVKSTRVSKTHAWLQKTDESWTITDNNSTNGTWINGERLDPKKPHLLRDNDRLVIGAVQAIFLIGGSLTGLCDLLEIEEAEIKPHNERTKTQRCNRCF